MHQISFSISNANLSLYRVFLSPYSYKINDWNLSFLNSNQDIRIFVWQHIWMWKILPCYCTLPYNPYPLCTNTSSVK